MSRWGKRGGSKKTPAQQAARRVNAAKAAQGRRDAVANRKRQAQVQLAVEALESVRVTPSE